MLRELAYSRTNPNAEKFDKRVLGFNNLGQKNVYNGDRRIKILGKMLLPDLDAARKRMKIVNGKMVDYKPSQAWFNYAKRFQPKPETLERLSF